MQASRLLYGRTAHARQAEHAHLLRELQVWLSSDDWAPAVIALNSWPDEARLAAEPILTRIIFGELAPTWRWAEADFSRASRQHEQPRLEHALARAVATWLAQPPLYLETLPFLETCLDIYLVAEPGPLTYTLAERLLLALDLAPEDYPITHAVVEDFLTLTADDDAPAVSWLRAHWAANTWERTA